MYMTSRTSGFYDRAVRPSEDAVLAVLVRYWKRLCSLDSLSSFSCDVPSSSEPLIREAADRGEVLSALEGDIGTGTGSLRLASSSSDLLEEEDHLIQKTRLTLQRILHSYIPFFILGSSAGEGTRDVLAKSRPSSFKHLFYLWPFERISF